MSPGSPAASIGLVGGAQTGTTGQGQPIYDNSGDLIMAIDGQRFPAFDDMTSGDAPLRYLRAHAGSWSRSRSAMPTARSRTSR